MTNKDTNPKEESTYPSETDMLPNEKTNEETPPLDNTVNQSTDDIENPLEEINITKESLDKANENGKKMNFITKFKYWKITTFIIIVIISVIIFFGIKSNNLIKSFSNSVYPESYVLSTDVSGLTKDELHSALETMIGEIGNTKIKINIGDKTFETSYQDINVTIPYDDFEKQILDYGKDQKFFDKLNLIKEPVKKDYAFKFVYNEEIFNEFLATIANEVNFDPVNSTINVSGGSISVTDSMNGAKLNSEELLANLKLAMEDITPKDELVFDSALLPVEEAISSDALQTVDNKISTFSTSYPAGPSGHNLEIAAGNIDNILLMPGDSFSCEEAIGPTIAETGFVPANTYVNGKVVKNYGGGVCQVSSTLYNTILRAGIIPSERQNHMMPVSYVPMGLDSTLADGVIDLRFTNNFDYPIVINSYAGNGNLTIEFWSNVSALNGLTYEAKSYPINSLSATAYLYAYDANGNLVSEQFLDTSTYQPLPN